jgi:hypothetical protein
VAKWPDGRNYLVAGSSGSGKTAWTLQQCRDRTRVLVWDAVEEWHQRARLRRVTSLAELGALIAEDIRPPGAYKFRVAYCGPVTRDHFATFCRLAWVWLRSWPGTLVVEELSDVTSPGKAPQAWGEIVRKGRHVAAEVFALSQRPAESDKTIVGNAALIHAGLFAFDQDRAYMARCLDVPVDEVAALGQLHWIERDMRTRELRRGVLKLRR